MLAIAIHFAIQGDPINMFYRVIAVLIIFAGSLLRSSPRLNNKSIFSCEQIYKIPRTSAYTNIAQTLRTTADVPHWSCQ